MKTSIFSIILSTITLLTSALLFFKLFTIERNTKIAESVSYGGGREVEDFQSIYNNLILPSIGKKVNFKERLISVDSDTVKLHDFLKSDSVLFFRVDSDGDIKNVYETARQLDSMDFDFFIFDNENSKSINALKRFKSKLYRLYRSNLNLPIENKSINYLFTIDPITKRIKKIFIPSRRLSPDEQEHIVEMF